MSWLQKLYETYQACAGRPQFENNPLPPECHSERRAHIEIVLDGSGTFRRASIVEESDAIVLPTTEGSEGRSGRKPPPHPLCDKLLYCAGDYLKHGGARSSFFAEYLEQLRGWQESEPHPKVHAVLRYVEKASVVADLIENHILHIDGQGRLLTKWESKAPAPVLLKILGSGRDQGEAVVRWRVQIPGHDADSLWDDPTVRASWIRFERKQETGSGFCMVTGELTRLAQNHPSRIRDSADRAKLISGNDTSGYTFRGRMDRPIEACSVGMIVTQKAHHALRWLAERQGYRSDTQTFVAWSITGKQIPSPFLDTAQLLGVSSSETLVEDDIYRGDAGQHFALRLKRAISGYQADSTDSDEVVVMGLDSAVPGRMAIIYYRELGASDFLERVASWHAKCSWPQRYPKGLYFVGAPAPQDIAETAYGRRLDKKLDEELRKTTVARLVPSIIDARPIPKDLVESAVRQACRRSGSKGNWEWEKRLGIACALVRGESREEKYEMSLEEDRVTRDYLFGRLLAIADNIEQRALHLGNEERETNAMKLLQRFADHPCSTWRSIEIALAPYKARLRAKRPAVLLEREKLLDAISNMFVADEFTGDRKLSGEFLLGFHCQRAKLWAKEDGSAKDEVGQVDLEKEGNSDE